MRTAKAKTGAAELKITHTRRVRPAKPIQRFQLPVVPNTLGTYYPAGNRTPVPCVVLEERDSGRMEILDLTAVKISTNGPSILMSFIRRVVAKKSITRAIDWYDGEGLDASIKMLCGLGFRDEEVSK